jgi:hypothetical protein
VDARVASIYPATDLSSASGGTFVTRFGLSCLRSLSTRQSADYKPECSGIVFKPQR